MSDRDLGYVVISRSLFVGDLWTERRVFSRAEAWIDIIQRTSFGDRVVEIGRVEITLKRGEFLASIRFLARRWNWSKSSVSRFVEHLKSEDQISLSRESRSGSIYHVVNYEAHQDLSREILREMRDSKRDRFRDSIRDTQTDTDQEITEEDGTVNGTGSGTATGTNINKGKDNESILNEFRRFRHAFNKVTGRNLRAENDKLILAFRARLKDYTFDELIAAVEAASKDLFIRGDNSNARDYLTIEYILRPDKADEWFEASKRKGADIDRPEYDRL